MRSTNFDIFKWAGAINRALVIPYYNVSVGDGTPNIVFHAQADYPSIAGIEVVRVP